MRAVGISRSRMRHRKAVVEESRTFVDRLHLQDRHDDALSFHVGVGEPHRAHQVGARLFVVADVVRVVDEPIWSVCLYQTRILVSCVIIVR